MRISLTSYVFLHETILNIAANLMNTQIFNMPVAPNKKRDQVSVIKQGAFTSKSPLNQANNYSPDTMALSTNVLSKRNAPFPLQVRVYTDLCKIHDSNKCNL